MYNHICFLFKYISAYINGNSYSFQVIPYFYKISMGKKRGEDVSAAEVEFTEKLSQLNEVGWNTYIFLKYSFLWRFINF